MSKSINTVTFIGATISATIIIAIIFFLNQDIIPPTKTIEKPISYVQPK